MQGLLIDCMCTLLVFIAQAPYPYWDLFNFTAMYILLIDGEICSWYLFSIDDAYGC